MLRSLPASSLQAHAASPPPLPLPARPRRCCRGQHTAEKPPTAAAAAAAAQPPPPHKAWPQHHPSPLAAAPQKPRAAPGRKSECSRCTHGFFCSDHGEGQPNAAPGEKPTPDSRYTTPGGNARTQHSVHSQRRKSVGKTLLIRHLCFAYAGAQAVCLRAVRHSLTQLVRSLVSLSRAPHWAASTLPRFRGA
jgi:hypothetical protein